MGRAPCCDKANVKKGPWSPEEDTKLKAYIENNGTGGNWIALPQKIGLKRCGKSCRLRWLNYLRPNIKHGGFSEEEDNIICNLYVTIGSRWSIIAAQLPGRTDNDIKNYWNTRLKKKLLNKQRKEFQETRMKQEMVMIKRQQQYQSQTHQSNDHLYLNNMFGDKSSSSSSPSWPMLLPHHNHQVMMNMNQVVMEPNYSCKPLIKVEEEQEMMKTRTNLDHNQESIIATTNNPFDFSFSQLLLDPNSYLDSGIGVGGGDFTMNSNMRSNTSNQEQNQELMQWFGSNFHQVEIPINEMFLSNTNNNNTTFGPTEAVVTAVATSNSADQSTISWEDITSLVNSEGDASYFNGAIHV